MPPEAVGRVGGSFFASRVAGPCMATIDTDDGSRPEAVLSAFIAGLDFGTLPDAAVDLAERAVVDTVGVTLAGADADAGARAGRFALATAGEGFDNGTDTDLAAGAAMIGRSGRAPVQTAALANATAGHALDYDDLSWAMDGHPSVPMVAPILAVGEATGATGADAVTAYVAGFETQCYLAEPVSPTHYERGWHPTATFGTFGATAAVCSLLDCDVATTRRALAVAASMPSGLKRNFGSMTKPLHPGLAARSGVTAALLADGGFTADDAPISADGGFFDLYADGAEKPPAPPGDPFRSLTEGLNVKYYPCCYFTHAAITATAGLVADHDLAPTDVERVEVSASRGADDALSHPTPETGLEAKFSMEYCVAAAVCHDRVGLGSFADDALADPAVEAIRETVEFDVDSDLPYDDHAATVRVVTADETYRRAGVDPPGVKEDPLTDGQLREKFIQCATRVLPRSTARRSHDRLVDLADRSSVAAVVKTLSP